MDIGKGRKENKVEREEWSGLEGSGRKIGEEGIGKRKIDGERVREGHVRQSGHRGLELNRRVERGCRGGVKGGGRGGDKPDMGGVGHCGLSVCLVKPFRFL